LREDRRSSDEQESERHDGSETQDPQVLTSVDSGARTRPLRGFYTAETPRKRPDDTLAGMLLQDPATLARPGAEPIPPTSQSQPAPTERPKIDVAHMNFYYGDNRVLQDVTVKMLPNHVTALIGPSGCGKST